MKPELEAKLVKKYPKIFKMVGSTPQESCMAWGMDCGDGWYWLIDQLCEELQGSIDRTKPAPPQLVATQVKEKFGGLRFYISSGSDEQYGAIHLAESMSYGICEFCGTTEDVGQTEGWISSLCPKCAKENGKTLKNE
jgi:hypothetical protein